MIKENWDQGEAGNIPNKPEDYLIAHNPPKEHMPGESIDINKYENQLTHMKYDAEKFLTSIQEYRFGVAIVPVEVEKYDDKDILKENPIKLTEIKLQLQPKGKIGHNINIDLETNSGLNFFSVKDKVLEEIKNWQPFKRIGPYEPQPESIEDKEVNVGSADVEKGN